MDRDDLELFERSLRHATTSANGAGLDRALDDLGWSDALATDERDAVATLFEQQGEANVTSSALDRVMGHSLGVDGAVVLPRLGSGEAPGRTAGDTLAVEGLGGIGFADAGTATVVAGGAVTEVKVADLEVEPVQGMDPTLQLVTVRAEQATGSSRTLREGGWVRAVAAGRRALGHELVGASRAMLQLARDHAVERIQFGVPIASFQAVRHRLAEAHVAIEAAGAALDAAWIDPEPARAADAKAITGRSARTVARHCQQVLAGIGFTAEHPFHRHLRRALVLDALLGDARSLTAAIGGELLATRTLPAPLPLVRAGGNP